MAMKPRVRLLQGAPRPPNKSKDTTVGDPDFGADVDAQNEKNKKDMPKPPPARNPPEPKKTPVRMMRGGMVKKTPVPKKMRGGGMVKKMRGGGMVKKMRGGGMVKKK